MNGVLITFSAKRQTLCLVAAKRSLNFLYILSRLCHKFFEVRCDFDSYVLVLVQLLEGVQIFVGPFLKKLPSFLSELVTFVQLLLDDF